MAKTFDESPRSNSILDTIPGGYMTLRHIFTLTRPTRLDFIVLENVERQEIGPNNANGSVAGRKFYDSKIIFLKNIGFGASNGLKGVFKKHILARNDSQELFCIWA